MIKKIKFLSIQTFILLLLISKGITSDIEKKLYSPDRKINIIFKLRNGIPFYSVFYEDKAVIQPSLLGFRFKDARPMRNNFLLLDAAQSSFDETWKPVWGTVDKIRNNYNQLYVKLKEEGYPQREMHLVFRAYNDGIAFRYILPEQTDLKNFAIISEETYFRFSGDHTAWWIPNDYDSYEHIYNETPLSQVKAANTPITMKTKDGLYLSIHEANLTDYAGMTLEPVRGENRFKAVLVPWPDGTKVKGSTPLKTPWRTIQISTRPGGLIESRLILNLNEPCVIKDTSWIKPVKYVGIWWGMHIGKYSWAKDHKHGATTGNTKMYIDFASKHGIPAVLVEGWNLGWERWGATGAYNFVKAYSDFNLKEVVDYGKKKGVFIIGHHETGGDVPTYDKQLEEAFLLYHNVGVPAVKTGYAGKIRPEGYHHHGQWMVNHYRKVVETAAKYRIMIDAHEPIKDTGISRTYPNMMTREGVRGTEYNAWSDGNPPSHVTILPFTRMLAGPLDYTPGIFDLRFDRYKQKERIRSTLANQLALYVVLFSPLQMAADLPENYEKHLDAFEFIKEVPCNWDETRVIDASIGDFVAIARRKGKNWYIGSVTNEGARKLEIPLSFLSTGKKYAAHFYSDSPNADYNTNPTAYKISRFIVDKDDTIIASLASGGGQAVSIKPATQDDIKKLRVYRTAKK
ncbi:MAG: glycoside hydrolase family 97 protein [Elusimicrobia bacterium]|nr:glycoside hydrolase family 97 protein [Elusimicrobiota bacterium]